MITGQEISATGKARSLEAGAGTVSRPMMGANAGSTPAPTLPSVEVGASSAEDLQNVGRSLLDTLAENHAGYSWLNDPAEVVVDLINERDEARGALRELVDFLEGNGYCALGVARLIETARAVLP